MTDITLDKSDPAVAQLIGSWQDGQTYYIQLKQVKTDGTKVTFQATDETEEEDAEPDEGETSETKEAPSGKGEGDNMGKMHKNPALMVLIGKNAH